MLKIFKRLLFLWFILLNSFLWADGEDTRITISDAASVYENSGTMSFTIQLSEEPDWGDSVTVYYQTINGSAKAGEDYTETNGSVTFYGKSILPPHLGDDSKTITVNIIDDNRYENSESFYVQISNSKDGYDVTDDEGYGIIYDDDTKPIEAKMYDRYEYERDNNWTLAFTVELNQNAPKDITLHYSTEDITAKAGEDYISSSGTITIAKNSKYGYINIPIIADTLPENNTEAFKVKLDSISEGTITTNAVQGTIVDDDAIKVDITSSDVNEGNIGDHNSMTFKIFLTKDYPLTTPLTINYTTEDGSSPSATENNDYNKTTGSVTFNKGDRDKIVNVPIIGDNTIEPDENLKMTISGSSYIIDSSSESEILNDDGSYPSVDFSTGDVSIVEGNSSTKTLNFHFELDKDALPNSSFDYYTQDDEATTADNDYVKINKTTYNIPAGTRDIDISVTINGDTKIEEDEIFYLKFDNEKNINITGHTAKGEILNDDGSYPILYFTHTQYSGSEGNSSQKDINITLQLDKPMPYNGSFRYHTTDNTGSSNMAIADDDYQSIDYTTYNISIGEQNITIPIKINGDTDIENDEDFLFELEQGTEQNISIDEGSKEVIILNDDGSYPTIDINTSSYTVVEGNSSKTILKIMLKLDAPALKGSSIKYYTADNTAQDGSKSSEDRDYIRNRGELAIEENATTASIDIEILGDTLIEPDESFNFFIDDAKNMTIGRSVTVINILNDDIHSNDPFVCDEHMYISSSKKRGSVETGKMWLHRIDTTQNPFRFEVMDDDGEDDLYNAIAYNPDDNYIYGLYYRNLIKLTKTGKVIDLGKITGLPDIFDTKQLYAGAINNGYYFITGRNTKQNYMFKIKLSDMSVEDINLTQSVAIQDFSFYNESNGTRFLYGIDKNGKLTKIDSITGRVRFIGNDHTGYKFDSSFSDKNGRFFANDSNGNGFFEFNLATGEKSFISSSQPATYNDGANCINAELLFTDYGDAPLKYAKTWHNISNGIYLGDKVDHDVGDYDTINADGDDLNGVDDDDGVTQIDGSDINGTYFETNATHQLKVKLSKEAYLKIWIDTKINGTFDNGDDLVYNSGSKLSAGEHTISFTLPPNLKENTKTYLRARVSSYPSMNPTGFVQDGEVEDYMIYFGDGVHPLRGIFNIERTNSDSYPINSSDRNAWFTQIVGRDFDYSLVFYEEDMSAQKELDNVTVKIDLIDEDTNATLYTKYAYIKNTPPKSRIDNLLPNDLDTLPATKRAIFKISYGVNSDGSIIQAPCTTNPKTCFDALPNTAFVYAKDDFAIRPDYFHIILYDNNSSIRVSTAPNNTTPLKIASGYDYNLSITASSYNGNDTTPSANYNGIAKRVLEFLDKSNIACPIKNDINSTENFINGKNTTQLLELQESGNYKLHIIDNSWSSVDITKGDCDINSSTVSANGNIKSGCNIVSIKDINLTSYPDHFAINLNIQNIPNSSHNDFIYMSEMNSTFNSVAIAYQGDIVAQSEDNNTNKNFTCGCMAQNVLLGLNATTLSDTGIDTPLKTSDGNINVNFVRTIEFNNDGNITVDKNTALSNLPIIDITADKFTSDHNGSANIDIRYNIDKNLSKTINPIKITFHSFEYNSTNSSSVAHNQESPMYIPNGHHNLKNTIRNFYFSQIAPDKANYPTIDFNIENSIRTPIQVEIFCGNGVSNTLCVDTNLTTHTNLASSPRAELGWYISIDHNGSVDGNIIELKPNNINPNVLSITPPTPIELNKGRIGTIMTRFTNPTDKQIYRVDIFCSPQLKHYSGVPKTDIGGNPIPPGVPDYIVSGSDNNSSTWTGVGRTGKILEIKSNRNSAHKMDW